MGDAVEFNIVAGETPAEAPVVTSRPDTVPEKFWDAKTNAVNTAALLQSYSELEKKVGGTPAVAETPEAAAEAARVAAEAAAAETPEVKDAEAAKIVEGAGLDMADLQTRFDTNGKLEDSDYEALTKVGVPKEMVDEFIELRTGKAAAVRAEMMSLVGGEEAYEGMAKWAGENWTPAQATEYNNSVNSKDKGRIELALKALNADYKKANGNRPTLLTPGTGPVVAGDKYASLDQMLKDQANPLYRSDPAERQRVRDKLARSDI